MAEVLLQLDEPLNVPGGASYLPRICGRRAEDGLWEGWIEFVPDDGSPILRSRRETKQSGRKDLVYWGTGLTRVYLEGALERTLEPPRPRVPAVPLAPVLSAYDGPAPEPPHAVEPQAVLNPFSVYAKGEDLLRQQLRALSAWHLRNIVLAYELLPGDAASLQRLGHDELAEVVVAGVRERTVQAGVPGG